MTRPAPGPITGRTPRAETPTKPRIPALALPDDAGRFYSWQDRAACRNADARLFFAPDSEKIGDKQRREEKALKICASCPVRTECVEHALSTPEAAGIWGLLEVELAAEVKRRRRHGARPVEALLPERAA